MLTLNELNSQVKCYPDTGKIIRIGSSDEAGGVSEKGYLRVRINRKKYMAHHLIFFFVRGRLPHSYMDLHHKDTIKLNNAYVNLEEIPRTEHNKKHRRNIGTNKVVGISFHIKSDTWHARISIDKKVHLLYRGHDYSEAVAYRLAAEQCFGFPKNSTAQKYMENKV